MRIRGGISSAERIADRVNGTQNKCLVSVACDFLWTFFLGV